MCHTFVREQFVNVRRMVIAYKSWGNDKANLSCLNYFRALEYLDINESLIEGKLSLQELRIAAFQGFGRFYLDCPKLKAEDSLLPSSAKQPHQSVKLLGT